MRVEHEKLSQNMGMGQHCTPQGYTYCLHSLEKTDKGEDLHNVNGVDDLSKELNDADHKM